MPIIGEGGPVRGGEAVGQLGVVNNRAVECDYACIEYACAIGPPIVGNGERATVRYNMVNRGDCDEE